MGAITSLFLYESITLVLPELFFKIISFKEDILSLDIESEERTILRYFEVFISSSI